MELRDFGGSKGVALLCGTDVLNLGSVELRGTPQNYLTRRFYHYATNKFLNNGNLKILLICGVNHVIYSILTCRCFFDDRLHNS